LVLDAKAHGVRVLPVDVQHSQAQASLEGDPPALRLGLAHIRGIPTEAVQRVLHARGDRPFRDIAELANRADLSRAELLTFAQAGALRSLESDRHQAAWSVLGLMRPTALWPTRERPDEATPLLPVPSEGQLVVADYHSLGLSLGQHPVALLRAANRVWSRPYVTHAAFKRSAHGARVAVVGLVLIRQRPPTAKGVMFVTLEDETGQANLVVWPTLATRFKRPLRAAVLLAAFGRVQREGSVVHLMVERVVDESQRLASLTAEEPEAGIALKSALQQTVPV